MWMIFKKVLAEGYENFKYYAKIAYDNTKEMLIACVLLAAVTILYKFFKSFSVTSNNKQNEKI